ncbi:hypothetical protein [Singulisphaera sp. PoT]|uniref:hypothetical protein n=1 Tax=Singulisphaera sp. PoT TaxID=3411797 RepID=UPI003BF463C4
MAKRNEHSRWRRLPQVFRFGEHKLPDTSHEPQRLTVYLPSYILDAAEIQAAKAEVDTVQEFCAKLLFDAIEGERQRVEASEIAARQGLLKGLQAIADDPEYLAEWSALVETKGRNTPDQPALEESTAEAAEEPEGEPSLFEPKPAPKGDPVVLTPIERSSDALSEAESVVLRHAGLEYDDPLAFLPCLRRGQSVSVNEVADLARALQLLEAESREAWTLDRRIIFALHRLAYEGQILHTDAWPGAFDPWTIEALRAVQEAVERILSGQDIRYSSPDESRENPR